LADEAHAYFHEIALPDLCFEAMLNASSFEPFDTC
jgi:hypothetical protein